MSETQDALKIVYVIPRIADAWSRKAGIVDMSEKRPVM